MRLGRAAAVAVIAACAALTAQAKVTDLQVKTVNGNRYYCYTVHSHDSVYGVADLLGVSRQDIIRYNPSAADGIRKDDVLYFPVKDFGEKPGSDESGLVRGDAPAGTTRYVVQRDETLFGVSRKFNVEPEDIIALNPQADYGISNGDVLYIPTGGETASVPAVKNEDNIIQISPVTPAAAKKAKEEVAQLAAPVQDPVATPVQNTDTLRTETHEVSVDTARVKSPFYIIVMLPFMLDSEASRAAGQITDFYKGLLVAADTLSATSPSVQITVIDTENSLTKVRDDLRHDPRIGDADVIIAPDNADQLHYISEFGREHDIYVMNAANARDDSYLLNPYVLQGLIPSQMMLDKAAAEFVAGLDGSTPVILRNRNGRDDKNNFVDLVIARLGENGIAPVEISYDGALTLSELEEQLGDGLAAQKYVFLPTSGTLGEFNKFSSAVARYRNKVVENGGDTRMFGYPEWTTFRNDTRRALHDMKTTIYTRSFVDMDSPEARGVNSAFERWYGSGMADGVPVQGLMGYDLGCYLLKALGANALGDENGVRTDFRGVQSAYQFRHTDNALGAVNTALYIVDFLPGGDMVDVQVK